MAKDINYLKKFHYLSADKYRDLWQSDDYSGYSKTHKKRIKNFWETFKHYNFDKKILSER